MKVEKSLEEDDNARILLRFFYTKQDMTHVLSSLLMEFW